MCQTRPTERNKSQSGDRDVCFTYKNKWCHLYSSVINMRDFRDGILQNPGIPGFIGRGLAWYFIPGFYQKCMKSLGISFFHKFGQFHTFCRTFLFLKYKSLINSHPVASSKSEQVISWQRCDPKKSLPRTRESRSLCYCQILPWSVKRHGLSK